MNKWVIMNGFLQNEGDSQILPDEWRKENYARIKNKWECYTRETPRLLIVNKQGTENDMNGAFYFLKMALLV